MYLISKTCLKTINLKDKEWVENPSLQMRQAGIPIMTIRELEEERRNGSNKLSLSSSSSSTSFSLLAFCEKKTMDHLEAEERRQASSLHNFLAIV